RLRQQMKDRKSSLLDDQDSEDEQPAQGDDGAAEAASAGDDSLDDFIASDSEPEAAGEAGVGERWREELDGVLHRDEMQPRNELEAEKDGENDPMWIPFVRMVECLVHQNAHVTSAEAKLLDAGLETARRYMSQERDEIGGGLGWVNAEQCGMLRDLKTLPGIDCKFFRASPSGKRPQGRLKEDKPWIFGADLPSDEEEGEESDGSGAEEDEEENRWFCRVCGKGKHMIGAENFMKLRHVDIFGRPYNRDHTPKEGEEECHGRYLIGPDCAGRVLLFHTLTHFTQLVSAYLRRQLKRDVLKVGGDTVHERWQNAVRYTLLRTGMIKWMYGQFKWLAGKAKGYITLQWKRGRGYSTVGLSQSIMELRERLHDHPEAYEAAISIDEELPAAPAGWRPQDAPDAQEPAASSPGRTGARRGGSHSKARATVVPAGSRAAAAVAAAHAAREHLGGPWAAASSCGGTEAKAMGPGLSDEEYSPAEDVTSDDDEEMGDG
ncbi:hypothetical protein CYMTET_30042, partial [Cymbomonas tetramitiformis]